MLIFHQGVWSTKAKKRNSAYFKISEKNPVSVKKKLPDTFSTSSKRLQDCKWKPRLCSTIFIISYQILAGANGVSAGSFAQCMCQSSTPIRNMYNLHNILYKISYNSISKPCVEQKKKIFNKIFYKYFMGHLYANYFSKWNISIFCIMCLLCAPCSSKQSQVQHVNFIIYVS